MTYIDTAEGRIRSQIFFFWFYGSSDLRTPLTLAGAAGAGIATREVEEACLRGRSLDEDGSRRTVADLAGIGAY